MSDGRVAVPLRDGLGPIVTYADRSTDIGSWHGEVPAPGRPVVSVRQNLTLLIDHGTSASNLDCLSCWCATLNGVIDPARSAPGITADGRLIWAAGLHLTGSALADALLGAGVVRAVQLDINPAWVAGYLYGHRGGKGRSPQSLSCPDRSGSAGSTSRRGTGTSSPSTHGNGNAVSFGANRTLRVRGRDSDRLLR